MSDQPLGQPSPPRALGPKPSRAPRAGSGPPPSPASGEPLHQPRGTASPAPLPPHCTPQFRPIRFPPGGWVTTSTFSPASRTPGPPSQPPPALQSQSNFPEPNPGASRSQQNLPRLLGTQGEASYPPPHPPSRQGLLVPAAPPPGVTAAPMVLPCPVLPPTLDPSEETAESHPWLPGSNVP